MMHVYPLDVADVITRAATPLPREKREAFIAEVIELARATNADGEGAIFRICREVQRKFFDPPLDPAGGKYS
jgi:hypothetical protein